MEKKLETTIMGYTGYIYICKDISPIMDNEAENKMEPDMETGGI